jgi:hypothetical protein
MQRISRISADFRKNRPEKANDSRRFEENSLRGRTGNFFAEQGIKVPCSGENRDIAPDAPRPAAFSPPDGGAELLTEGPAVLEARRPEHHR